MGVRAEVTALTWFDVFCFCHSMKYWCLDSLMIASHVKIHKLYIETCYELLLTFKAKLSSDFYCLKLSISTTVS